MIRRRPHEDHGYLMVPVIVFMTMAVALGLAFLAIVDTQTSQSASQRSSDTAQTLAEGLVTATATVLAGDQSASAWPTTGACQTITGDVGATPTGSATSLPYRLATEINSRFGDSASQYVSSGTTSWKVSVCPVLGTSNGTSWTQSESRWSDSFLSRTVNASAGTGPAQISLWVRGQATVPARLTRAGVRSKAVASKIRQSSYGFTPPAGYAIGTGAFTTDLSAGLDSVLTNTSGLVGGLTSTVLGNSSSPLIAPTSSKIGVRCGLLDTLSHITSPCLSGTIAGVNATTQSLNLGVLNGLLGTSRTESLGTWSMAPTDAIAAWKTEAQSSGVYLATSAGAGGSITSRTAAGAPNCLATGTVTTGKVVFIDQVGNGSQYCTLDGSAGQNAAKIFIVRKGGVRITGTFTGVVYALNAGECSNSDGTCSTSDREGAAQREVVRIEGASGKVIGQVWADGAGGSVGIYPTASPVSATQTQLIDSIGGSSGICGTTNLGTVLNTLQSSLNGVGALLGVLVGNKQVRYPGGASTQPDKCTLLKAKLATMTVAQLEALYQNGGTVSVTVSEHRTCSLVSLVGICIGTYSAWSSDSTDMVNLTIPPLLTDATLVGQLATVLGSTLGSSSYSAITYDATAVANAKANITTGAGPVIGSYRNVTPS